MRTLQENNHTTEYPIAVINWTKCHDVQFHFPHATLTFPYYSEEGARFPKSVISSQVWAGVIPIEVAWALQDVKDSSKTMKSELSVSWRLFNTAASHTTPYSALVSSEMQSAVTLRCRSLLTLSCTLSKARFWKKPRNV